MARNIVHIELARRDQWRSMPWSASSTMSKHPRRIPWTREQIEAWVEQPKDRAARVSRRALVRFCPEVADYEDLKRRINAATKIHWVPRSWRESLSEEEIAEYVRASIAALWDQSLSEPSDGEARRA